MSWPDNHGTTRGLRFLALSIEILNQVLGSAFYKIYKPKCNPIQFTAAQTSPLVATQNNNNNNKKNEFQLH